MIIPNVGDFDADLEDAVRRLAEREGISTDQAAIRLMRRGMGIPDADVTDGEGIMLAGPFEDEDGDPYSGDC